MKRKKAFVIVPVEVEINEVGDVDAVVTPSLSEARASHKEWSAFSSYEATVRFMERARRAVRIVEVVLTKLKETDYENV